MIHADFDYHEIKESVIVIFDNDNGKSVTNDIDYVLSVIRSDHMFMKKNYTVIYCDTMGMFDEIIVDDNFKFIAFKAIQENDFEKALNVIEQRRQIALNNSNSNLNK